jgi:hypothetical protein
MDTNKAVKFIWENYFLSLDFNVEPMIKFIKSSRKAEAMLIDTDLIDKEQLANELKKLYFK